MPRVPSAAAAHIGGRIAEARQRYTLTQDQLAVRAGVDSSNIRSYESGRAMMNIHTLIKIASALDTEPGYFLDGIALTDFGPSSRTRQTG